MSDRPNENHDTLPALGRAMLWVDNKNHVTRFVYGLYLVCAGLFLTDFLYRKYTYVDVENIPGFYAMYGFFLSVGLVICAKWMRKVLQRPEDYYAPKDIETEEYPATQLDRAVHDD